ncbi:hypothetical protein HY632_01055 [Candidatus Uhrbacteria bacterium]|nr:hypothetical protein [Candidatus Uhrbacteria bacterium]
MERSPTIPLLILAVPALTHCAHPITIGYQPDPPAHAHTHIVTMCSGTDARTITALPLITNVQDPAYQVETQMAFGTAVDEADLVGTFTWPMGTDVRELMTPLAEALNESRGGTAPLQPSERDSMYFDIHYLLLTPQERVLIDRASWLLYQWLPQMVGAHTFDSFLLAAVRTSAVPIVGITAPHIFTQLRYRTRSPHLVRASLASEHTQSLALAILNELYGQCLRQRAHSNLIADVPEAGPAPSRALCTIMRLPSFQHFLVTAELFAMSTILVPPPRDLATSTTTSADVPSVDARALHHMRVIDGITYLAKELRKRTPPHGALLINSEDTTAVTRAACDLGVTLRIMCTPRGCTP